MRSLLSLAGLLVLGLPATAAPMAPVDPKGAEFFEKKIRPVLTEACFKCHSAEAVKEKKIKANLFLDSREGLLKGGDSGPAIVPGKPQESLLLQSLHYEGDVRMPPKGKLPEPVIRDFETWIAMGAPDPRGNSTTVKQVGLSIEAGRKFWAYQPVRKPTIPQEPDSGWARTDLDRFILSRLQKEKLSPAPDAAPEVLVRRLYIDLIGLPPTPEQAGAFIAGYQRDQQTTLTNTVDQLLASPQFGERWGRHWLDVARFAESLTLRGFILKESWRYRDYVIDAFNADMPYSQFLREQLAGDLLPASNLPERRRQLTATTFLTMGNNNLEDQDKKNLRMDVVDEMLDVVTKGLLAQTVTCARCHDHKFDPIPTKDYYALAGILRNAKALEHANVSKWIEMPLPASPEEEAVLKKHEEAIAALQAQIKAEKANAIVKGPKQAGGVLAIKDVPGIVIDEAMAKKVGTWKESQFSGTFIGKGYIHDENTGKGEKTLSFQPDIPATGKYEVWLAYSSGNTRATNVPVTIFSADGEKTIAVDMTKAPPLSGRYLSLGQYRFEKTGQSFVIVSNEGTKGHVTADAVIFLSEETPRTGKPGEATASKAAPQGNPNRVAELEAELKKLQASGPKREMVMTIVEEKTIEDCKVHIRGNVHNLGAVAPRGFLQVATYGPMPTIPADQSGRKELADWIASEQNPLTARVLVNRVWHWLFGSGIVRTVDNFGTTGEAPSHPELLDYLAHRFVTEGWSIKKLVREIVLSRTYGLSTTRHPRYHPSGFG
jgi:cytochrome c553